MSVSAQEDYCENFHETTEKSQIELQEILNSVSDLITVLATVWIVKMKERK